MYAFIANGYKGIIDSKESLEVLASIYPYPKWKKCFSYEEACNFLDRNKRRDYSEKIRVYGDTDKKYGFCTVSYVIDDMDLYCSIDTSKVGYIRIDTKKMKDIVVDNRPTMINLSVRNIRFNDSLISDHCAAITTLLCIIGEFVDVNIVVPDVSIYLALTQYTGKSYIINECRETIKTRLGGVSYTIKE